MSEVNSSEIKRKLEAEVSYLTNLIKHHEEKKGNQSYQTHYLPRVYSSYTSRSSQTNTQNKINMHSGKSYKFVKNNQAHFRSSAGFHKPVNTKIYQSNLSFKSKYKLPNSSQFNEPIQSFEQKRKETVFYKPRSEQDVLKLSSPQTLCKEIVSTTEKLKKKLEDMAKAKLVKDLAVKRHKLPEQVQLMKSSKDNDVKKIFSETDQKNKITKQNSAQIVSYSAQNREEMRRDMKQPQQEFLKTTVSKSLLSKCFIQKASCTIKLEKNSKDYDAIDCNPETEFLNSVSKLSPKACSITNHANSINEVEANTCSGPSKVNNLLKSENPCDVQDINLKPFHKSKASEDISNKVETLANIASKHVASNKRTVINKLAIAKSEKSDYLELAPLVIRTNIKNKRKSICKPNLSLSVKNRIPTKRLSASKKKVITKYKVVNKALYTFKRSNIAQIAIPKRRISVSPKKQLFKSSKYCSGKLSSKYKIVNNELFSYSSCETKYVKEKSCESPKSLTKSRENLTKYKVINRNSTNYAKGNLEACTTLENKLTKMHKMDTIQISSKKRLNSRYKVENKPTLAKITSENIPKCKLINRKDSLRKTKRLIHSRFAIINKKLSPRIQTWESPLKIQPMLTKRIYKSPRTIINKNVSSIYQVARMIKTKYRIVNKSKSQFIKPWYRNFSSKNRLSTAKGFSGHFIKSHSNSKSYTFPQRKKNQQFYGRTKRNFLNYNPKRTTLRIGGISYNASKTKMFRTSKKLQKYVKNEQVLPPVLVIRGVRFAIDPSEKTLKRLSSGIGDFKDHKSPRKVVVCGKTFVRVADDVLKEENSFSKSLASRMLHRSIHRVRAASTKKNMKKTNKYCQFYNRFGRCNDGIKCAYIHDPSKIAVCTRFLRGTCKVDGCLFSHEISPGKMALCSFFLLGSCNNSKCPYRHEVLTPGTKLCTDFVQGYCSKGKQCKKAHILVCPHYIQGNCEKGPLCAYPHPPQKKRKFESDDQPEHVESSSTDNANAKKKVDDNLLDSVSRYFHCGIYRENKNVETTENENMPVANDVSNVVVSKRCKLSVQPSFIPLSTEER